MRLRSLPLLLAALLPLAPLCAAEKPLNSIRSVQNLRHQDSLGLFLKRLGKASAEEAAAMLDSMPDLNAATSREHITALHASIAYNRLDITQMLLQRGARTDLLMSPGLTPLSAAAMKNDTDAIALLLKHGAPLNHQTAGGVSALKLACAKGNLDAAQVLLAHGADPKPADSDGHTALTLAQAHGGENRVVLMRMLLEHGAKPNAAVGADHISPLMNAVLEHDIDAAELLLEYGAEAEPPGNGGSSPLMMAASYGYTALVEHLLQHGATVSRQDDDGNDALDCAVLGAGFMHDVSAIANGDSPGLRNAEAVDTLATCRLLLEHGASVTHRDYAGNTPLIIAARMGSAECVRLLLEHGADVHACNHEGQTALISALLPAEDKLRQSFNTSSLENLRSERHLILTLFEQLPGMEETIRLLLNAGADTSVRDTSGRNAFDHAGTPALRTLLIQGPEAQE